MNHDEQGMRYTAGGSPVNPFLEDIEDSRIKVISPGLGHIEFWTPQGEFFITIKWDSYSKKFVIKSRPNSHEGTVIQWTLHLDTISAIRILRGMGSVSLIEAKQAIDKIAPTR